MKNAIRKPHKDVKVSKWLFIIIYILIILTISYSFTLAKYITVGTFDDSVRVSTSGEYKIRLSTIDSEIDYNYLQNNTDGKPIIIGADSANDIAKRAIYIYNDSPSEVICTYSIVLVAYGKLPISFELVPSGSSFKNTFAKIFDNDLKAKFKSRYIDLGCNESDLIVLAYTGGIFPINTATRHEYLLKTSWTNIITNDESELQKFDDNYLLEKEIEYVDIYVIVNQLDNT